MKNNKKAKSLLLVVLALLLLCTTIAGTLAYLTSEDSVTNTFTVGDVTITLDETIVDVDGKAVTGDGAGRNASNEYHLIPGSTYTKDPVVHVQNDSESCWLFVKVENGIADIEAKSRNEEGGYKTIHDQIIANQWTELTLTPGEGETIDYKVYYKSHTELDKEADGYDAEAYTDYAVFGNFMVEPYWNGEGTTGNIVVTAYAIQAENVSNEAAEAWATLNAQLEYNAENAPTTEVTEAP